MTVKMSIKYRCADPSSYGDPCADPPKAGDDPEYTVFEFGTKSFPNVPLILRAASYERDSNVGYGKKRINVTLNGFLEGDNHEEVVRMYKKLSDVFVHNDLRFTYEIIDTFGTYKIIDDQPIYMDSYNEPSAWKQYNGDYEITFHYYEDQCYTTDLGIRVVYTPDETLIANPDSYIFNPCPMISKNSNRKRDWNADNKTRYGKKIGKEVYVTLKGFLSASSNVTLQTKIDRLEQIFSLATRGSLTYGCFTHEVRIVQEPQFSLTFPRNHVDYEIQLAYGTDEIFEISTEITFSRVHKFPKIRNRLYCAKIEVTEYIPSGQYVDYSLRLKAKDRETTRQRAQDEFNALVYQPGLSYKLEGGTERWLDDNSIEIKDRRFYIDAILINIEDSSALP